MKKDSTVTLNKVGYLYILFKLFTRYEMKCRHLTKDLSACMTLTVTKYEVVNLHSHTIQILWPWLKLLTDRYKADWQSKNSMYPDSNFPQTALAYLYCRATLDTWTFLLYSASLWRKTHPADHSRMGFCWSPISSDGVHLYHHLSQTKWRTR